MEFRTEFMGHPTRYWIELQQRVDETPFGVRLLEEIAELRGKVSFYESRIRELNDFARRNAEK